MDTTSEDYLLQHIEPEDPVLYGLYRETHLNVVNARQMAGHLQGTILSMLSKMIQPTCILEIGTFTGYAAICLARGLREGGKLYTIEANDELRDITTRYFEKSGLVQKIELINGNALEIVPTLQHSFDIVFIDAEKNDYLHYYELVFDKVKNGGYIFADNVLWDGKVFDPTSNDRTTQSLREFNKKVNDDPRVEVVILPVRDGLTVIRKR